MQKQRDIDYKDTNVANIGSKENRAANKAKAESEPEYKGAGADVGVEVWRVENFGVKKQKGFNGCFFSGDSYIVLNTYKKKSKGKESKALSYDVHFWLGKDSSQDEKGTAAFKTVELDDLLDDVPVQWREVEGHESKKFLNIFGGCITTKEGGIASAFRNVKAAEYKARLMHFTGVKTIHVSEVPLARASLNMGDVFLLDNGLELIQWNGRAASVREKRRAMTYVQALKEERMGRPKLTILDGDEDHPSFWDKLGGKGPIAEPIPDVKQPVGIPKILEVSDASGEMLVTVIAQGKSELKRSLLNEDDAFIVDTGSDHIYIWVGSGANKNERRHAMRHACNYVTKNGLPDWTIVTRVISGAETSGFKKLFGAASF